jgi:hypothetical protein
MDAESNNKSDIESVEKLEKVEVFEQFNENLNKLTLSIANALEEGVSNNPLINSGLKTFRELRMKFEETTVSAKTFLALAGITALAAGGMIYSDSRSGPPEFTLSPTIPSSVPHDNRTVIVSQFGGVSMKGGEVVNRNFLAMFGTLPWPWGKSGALVEIVRDWQVGDIVENPIRISPINADRCQVRDILTNQVVYSSTDIIQTQPNNGTISVEGIDAIYIVSSTDESGENKDIWVLWCNNNNFPNILPIDDVAQLPNTSS